MLKICGRLKHVKVKNMTYIQTETLSNITCIACDPGEYAFRVRGVDHDDRMVGPWSELSAFVVSAAQTSRELSLTLRFSVYSKRHTTRREESRAA